MTRLLSLSLVAALSLSAITLPITAAVASEASVSVEEIDEAYALFDDFAGEMDPGAEAEAEAVAHDIVDATWANHGSLAPLEIAIEDAALRALAGEDLGVVLDDFSHATPELEQALSVYPPGDNWFDVSLPRWLGRILTIIVIIILI